MHVEILKVTHGRATTPYGSVSSQAAGPLLHRPRGSGSPA